MNTIAAISILTVLAFLSMGLWLFLKKNKINYPPGTQRVFQVNTQLDDWTVRVIGPSKITRDGLHDLVHGMQRVWIVDGMLFKYRELVLYFAPPNSGYFKKYQHGLQLYLKGPIGKDRVPMLVVSEQLVAERQIAVLIHEAVHLYHGERIGDPDARHSRPDWEYHENVFRTAMEVSR